MTSTQADMGAPVPSNIEIAQHARMQPILSLARERLGIPEERLEPYGRFKAKGALDDRA